MSSVEHYCLWPQGLGHWPAVSQGLNLFRGSVAAQEDKQQHVLLRAHVDNISTFQTCTGKFTCWLRVLKSHFS